ncbi:uncharacterized protein LOC108048469 [Drosophila rhopaloa]|uniref:Uncharacterized protein LOC108048469 n=1 Tax=Drosophila rhopaloa TaxID=1041015 RepID=A0A6P4FBH1_DRORH|nr:uncharacterized protein LOC108048469 [Drosophila rhopaloa]
MHYLHVLGFLVFFATYSSSLDRALNRRRFMEQYKDRSWRLTMNISQQRHDPVLMSLLQRDYNDHKLINRKDLFPAQMPSNDLKRYSGSNYQPFTPFEKRVIRLLIRLGILKSKAEIMLETLEKDKELLKRLKKLLDDVDEEQESDDFFENFFNLIFE